MPNHFAIKIDTGHVAAGYRDERQLANNLKWLIDNKIYGTSSPTLIFAR